MPEGDTIHKIAAHMRPLMHGKCLRRAVAARSRLPELEGRQVEDVSAHGKHLMVHCTGWILRVHLGMHGDWHRYAVGETWRRPAWQASVVLDTGADVFVCFNAQDVECLRPAEVRDSQVGQLGPDLLAPQCDLTEVLRRARAVLQDAPLVDILLNQHVAAGLGNVYKSELLFMHRLHPLTQVGHISTPLLHTLFSEGRRWLQANVGGWRRTTTYDRRQGETGAPRLYVYGRKGEPCFTCQDLIVRQDLGKHRRSTYWCNTCQARQTP